MPVARAGAPVELIVYSAPDDDGRILRPFAGVVAADATGGALRIGDDDTNRSWRSILSFNTALFPAHATLIGASLHMVRGTSVSPTTALGAPIMEVKTGSFSDNAALQDADFADVAGVVVGGVLQIGVDDGTASDSPLNAAGLAAINRDGLTQIRIRYPTNTNSDFMAQYQGFYAADAPGVAADPYLIIRYTVADSAVEGWEQYE